MFRRKSWRLNEWNETFARGNLKNTPMSREEVRDGIRFLRSNNYPKPEDCPEESCPDFRPACKLGICHIAVGLCRDF